jgi:uncharacterized protein DUF6697
MTLKTSSFFDQELGIWLMKCVGYDNDFQRELCNKFPLWVPPPRKPKGSGKSMPKKKSQAAGRKRKREESLDSDNERGFEGNTSLGGEFDDLSEDEDQVPTYRP